MSKRDYYEVLGVSKSSTEKEIKKAYKRLAMKYHPDKNQGDAQAADKFKEIKEAYEVLTDPDKRGQYDDFGHAAFQNGGNGGFGGGFGGGQSQGFGGFEDIFGSAFGGRSRGGFGSGGFEDMFSQHRQPRAQKGQDRQFNLTVDFADAIKGCEQIIELPVNGVNKKINVKVPAGIEDGEKIRFAGKGESGINGGPAGDLLIQINTRPHATLKRDGNDLICPVTTDFVTAALGGEVEIQTLESRFKLKVPAGTQNGRKFRMKEKGVKSRKGVTGDLLVEITVATPTNLTEEQKTLLMKFKEIA
ncbi:DnaJ domain-containing protein [Aliivibrio fischeri]|uniref:DnaJ domain-containing protein n=1 Tax=Aliivibrio fischeri TaxID=668 RepID=A0A6I3Y9Y7_ALIFS|nr:DnaJ C-terminal domain-containing protein [Aliivibrio fischeri]MUI53400.1 DnaJ domain-containing protein [Aliivibrio fischeri]MUJ23105.1 DnaJ domain-containing protein [Aliivibrio fischeri]MUJ37887.1 DnaJ domain-containing protein [Aliivibrio fischeri]MUK44496.1 DnaJ domain-containing protein [Aliivibrio fischeri]MUK60856.1 DnaJ domain-containing protein [Aliivibrio fischeri]